MDLSNIQFFSSLFSGLTLGAIYALIALGLSMVYGVLNLINFAHGEIFMVGSFAGYLTLTTLGVGPETTPTQRVFAIAAAILSGIIASGVAAVVLEIVAYRPLRILNAPRHAGLISGVGASIMLQETFAWIFSRNVVTYPEFFPTVPLIRTPSGDFTNKMALILVASVVMLLALDTFVQKTRLGRGIRAMGQDPQAAVLLGVNISTIAIVTFLVGGLCAGLGGPLYAMYYNKTRYQIGFLPGVKGFTAAILGGVGNMRGAMLGGLLLGLFENFGTIFIPSELKDVIAFVILVLVLLFRPTGILGVREGAR